MTVWLPWAIACLALCLATGLCLYARRMALRERRLRQLLDATPHPMYLRDPQGRLLSSNQNYQQNLVVAQDPAIEALHAQALRCGQATVGDRIVHTGGRPITLHHWALPVRDDAGEVAALACGWVDISERSAREAQLDRANVAKTRFLATLSHEIRNPLNALTGLLELAAQDPAARDAATLQHAHSAGLAVLALVDDALDTACAEAGHVRVSPRATVLSELLHATCGLFAHPARQKGLELSLHIAPAARGCFTVDPDRLRQVLSNLLCNAIKYTERGQVQVRLKGLGARPGQVANLWLSISDTGTGISPADQQRAFAPFTQVGNPSQRSQGGLGLGLSICKQIAPLLGARLLLRSRSGQGTCVALRLRLPATDPTVAVQPSGLTAHPRGTRGKALIIDDHPANRLLLTRQLTQLGFAPIAVASTLAGLRACRRERYALVITDCSLSGHDGFTFARALRRLEQRQQRKPSTVVGYTAHTGAAVRERCLAAGMDGCLHKPVDIATLRSCLAAYLGVSNGIDLRALDHGRTLQQAIRAACAEDRQRLAGVLPRNALVELAHRVKGMAMMINACDLATAAAALEQAGATGERLDQARQALAEALLEQELGCVPSRERPQLAGAVSN